jgi:hypothetical protein
LVAARRSACLKCRTSHGAEGVSVVEGFNAYLGGAARADRSRADPSAKPPSAAPTPPRSHARPLGSTGGEVSSNAARAAPVPTASAPAGHCPGQATTTTANAASEGASTGGAAATGRANPWALTAGGAARAADDARFVERLATFLQTCPKQAMFLQAVSSKGMNTR